MSVILRTLSENEVQTLLDFSEASSGNTAIIELLPVVVLQASLRSRDNGTPWFWCAPRLFIDEASGKPVGSGSFLETDSKGKFEFGYGTGEKYRGQGIASQGAALMLALAHKQDPKVIIIARTSISNPASARVLIKNGFERYGQTIDPEEGVLYLWRQKPPLET